MFSLIITIISIALVAALALATLYYGGSAFNRGSAGATASQLINEGQQLNGAVSIAKADEAAGQTASVDLQDLVDNKYLSQLPSSFSTLGATLVSVGEVTKAVSDDVCKEIQKRATGSETVPATKPTNQVYGCFGATGAGAFFYKL